MKIIILGAGHAGSTIARALAREEHDVTVIDINPALLRELQDQMDIATVMGIGTYPETLKQANLDQADILIAVMPADQDNIVACQIAWLLFEPQIIIARIRNRQYLDYPDLFARNRIPIDVIINPESLVTRHVQSLIKYPGVRQLHEFAGGLLFLAVIHVNAGTPATKLTLSALRESFPHCGLLALMRENQLLPLEGNEKITSDDLVIYLTSKTTLKDSIGLFRAAQKPYKRLMLAGGGHVGKALAEKLEKEFQLKVIEKNTERASHIAESLQRTYVLEGSATDQNLLRSEGVAETDVFCALTNSDETNVLSSLMAKKMGVKQTICLVNKPAYVDLISGNAIDAVFSPGRITSAHILKFVHENMIDICPILGSSMAVMEIMIEGGEENSRVIGLNIDQLELPEGVKLGALLRKDDMQPLNAETKIENRDRAILLAPSKQINNVENYFLARQ